jgi:hypothetical protein
MSNIETDLARELFRERQVEVEQSRRARHAQAVRRLQRRAERLSQRAERVSRRAERATAQARRALARAI